jgi:hypothetical protein
MADNFLRGALALIMAVQSSAMSPERFRTAAHFSVDANQLSLASAVALVEPHPRVPGMSWVHVYFYAMALTPGDVAAAAKGSVEALDRRQMIAAAPSARNASRAVLHFLREKDGVVSNVSLELPGVTCTIAETPEEVRAVFPELRFSAADARARGAGRFACDLQSIGMGKPALTWNVDAAVPAFAKAPAAR